MEIIEFIVERYNYWIFITLMMTGLYIVISRGNLVKTIVGLNLFQTSVFIFYISIGKIAAGTAPILIGDYDGEDHGEGHGSGHGGEHGSAHEAGYDGNSLHAGDTHGADAPVAGIHGDETHAEASLHDVEGVDVPANSLNGDLPQNGAESAAAAANGTGEGLHQMQGAFTSTSTEHSIAAAASHGAEVIYTNPLPHVLILTAIVVGVATTAVGLALAVRIREAYGSIEEDELEAADHFAEFGVPLKQDEQGGAA